MRALCALIICSCAIQAAQATITPVLGIPFGEIACIEFLVVEKPNDYFAQNMVKEDFYLRILAIDGHAAAKDLDVAPINDDGSAYVIGKTYTAIAYESVSSRYEPRDWPQQGDVPRQMNYFLDRRVVISRKPPRGR